jgi:hypothetical protein
VESENFLSRIYLPSQLVVARPGQHWELRTKGKDGSEVKISAKNSVKVCVRGRTLSLVLLNEPLTHEDAEKFLAIGQKFSYFLSAWEGAIDSAKMLKKELEKAIED